MNYIPDIHEALVAPPFLLGLNGTNYRLECNHFLLETKPPAEGQTDILQQVVDEQLNAALPNGTARHLTHAGDLGVKQVHYSAVPGSHRAMLSLLRYWRAASATQPEMGEIAYTEAMLHFIVRREVNGQMDLAEALRFVAVVYIDDSAFKGQLQDPHSYPILIGREAYGMPKLPGQILYCPSRHTPGTPKVQIWDTPTPGGGRLALEDAIVFDPDNWTEPPEGYCPTVPAVGGEGGAWGDPENFHMLATMFDLDARELERRLGELPRDFEISEDLRRVARTFRLDNGERLIVYEDLELHMKLVGHRQFPDPLSSHPSIDSIHSSIVETALELPEPMEWDLITNDQLIEFPSRHVVDLVGRLGLVESAPRRVHVPAHRGKYMRGRLIFANPKRIDVWEPT